MRISEIIAEAKSFVWILRLGAGGWDSFGWSWLLYLEYGTGVVFTSTIVNGHT